MKSFSRIETTSNQIIIPRISDARVFVRPFVPGVGGLETAVVKENNNNGFSNKQRTSTRTAGMHGDSKTYYNTFNYHRQAYGDFFISFFGWTKCVEKFIHIIDSVVVMLWKVFAAKWIMLSIWCIIISRALYYNYYDIILLE